MNVSAEDLARGLPVLPQQRGAGEADEDRALEPALHLLVHVAALGAVALVHEHVEAAGDARGRPRKLRRVELVDQRADQARRRRAQPAHELVAARHPRRWRIGANDARVAHHALDLLVELVAVGDDQHTGIRLAFEDPFGQQHHKDALARPLGVPDDAALALGQPLLRQLHADELVLPGHFLDARVEDHEVPDQVEQPFLAQHLPDGPVE